MPKNNAIKQEWCRRLSKAFRDKKPIDSLAEAAGELSVAEAYDVQAMLVDERIRQGERIIGWKIGLTSRATMEQLGMDEPVLGCMTSGTYHGTVTDVKASRFCKLAVEGEIAFVMGRPLRGPGVTHADVITATTGIMGAVELVDSRFKEWKASTAEGIADNAFHAGIIMGPVMKPIAGFDLIHEGVVLRKNGRLLASACGVEALDNPLKVVAWLADKLAELDREIRPGEIISTGSLTKFFYVEPGDVLDVSFSNLGTIHFAVTD